MNRLIVAAAGAVALVGLVLGLALAAPTPTSRGAEPATRVSAPDAPDAPDARRFDIWMSTEENGPMVRSVSSATNQVWAVLEFEDAAREAFRIQLRDLTGIVVKSDQVLADGTGRVSLPISVTDFVATYLRAFDAERRDNDGRCISGTCAMLETVAEAALYCENIPEVPDTWPGPPSQPTAPPGQPTPTPIPPYYRMWADAQLSLLASNRAAVVEVSRTIQSVLAMPDAQLDLAMKNDFGLANGELRTAFLAGNAAEASINPQTGRPDPQSGCQRITTAKSSLDSAMTHLGQATARITAPETWRLPPTQGRWSGNDFLGCLQYNTEVFTGGTTAADSVRWTVGEPGVPRLIFPSPEQADRSAVGELKLTLPPGANAIYARSVTVPGVNHTATIGAFVTDAQCIPAQAVTMTLSVLPSQAGQVSPVAVPVLDGVAQAVLSGRDDAASGAAVQGFIQTTGKGEDPGPSPPGIQGSVAFQVVGPATMMHFLMQLDRRINIVERQSLPFAVQVRDAFRRSVADGTVVTMSVPDTDPGLLAYERRPRQNPPGGVPTPTPELVVLGKTMELKTQQGMTQLDEDPDPAYVRRGPLLMCSDEVAPGQDMITLSATADGATGNTNDPDTQLKTIRCVEEYRTYLPRTYKRYDPRATQPWLPIETATPSPTPVP